MTDGTLIHAQVTHKPGALRLDGFPLLVHSPAQWGPGVRTEDNGTPVESIAAAHAGDFAATATKFGTSEKHVRQAVAYTIAMGA
jgi:hypothetical protein